jgi:hypothetical protein
MVEYGGAPPVFNYSGNTKNNSDGFSMVELAVSRDLIHWERVGKREKFIPLSQLEGGELRRGTVVGSKSDR